LYHILFKNWNYYFHGDYKEHQLHFERDHMQQLNWNLQSVSDYIVVMYKQIPTFSIKILFYFYAFDISYIVSISDLWQLTFI